MLTNIKAVVFDLDNTLVSSNLDFKTIKHQLGCPTEQDLLKFVADLPAIKQQSATEFIYQHELADANTAHELAGCQQIISTLSRLDLHTAIVTRNCKDAAAIKVNNNQINIKTVLTREDHVAKPAPDALYFLANKWQIDCQDILYVGDYIYDIQLAQNASAISCLLTYQRTLSFAQQADITVANLLELDDLLKQQLSATSNQIHSIS